MKLPLSVTTGPSFFTPSRITGRPPSPRSCAMAGATAKGMTSTGTGALKRGTTFSSSTTTINRNAAAATHFSG